MKEKDNCVERIFIEHELASRCKEKIRSTFQLQGKLKRPQMQKSKKSDTELFSKSSRVAIKSRVRPEWYPSNRHDPSSFTAAADLVAQMRYEQLIESRAQRLMREHWAEGIYKKAEKN